VAPSMIIVNEKSMHYNICLKINFDGGNFKGTAGI